MELEKLIQAHKDDLPGLRVFTAYSAAIPVHRVSASLLVQEAIEADPIDLFLLRGIEKQLNTVERLSSFYGLDRVDVEVSLAAMLHNEWISASRSSSDQDAVLSLLPTGWDVLTKQRAVVQQTREAEIWVDAVTGTCELKPPRRRLWRPKDAKQSQLFFIREQRPKPRVSGELNFPELQASIAQLGSEVWAGTKLNLLLDVLGMATRNLGYRPVEIMVIRVPSLASL